MTRLANHDDEVFNSWRDQEAFGAAEFFPVPQILPDPVRRPDFAKVARLANRLKRGISDTLPFHDLVMVALELLYTFRVMVMSQMQWQDYREALRRRDEQAGQGRRGPTSTQPSQSHPTCAPVNPMIDETAVEYAGVWVLNLAYREGRQRANILGNFYNTLQDIVAFAICRGPRIHYSVIADLLRRRAQRANVDLVATGGGWDRPLGYEHPFVWTPLSWASLSITSLSWASLSINTRRRIINVAARRPDVLVLVDGILKRVDLVLILMGAILKCPVLVPVRLQDGKVQVPGLPRGDIDLEPAAAPLQQLQQPDLPAEQVSAPQGEPTNAAHVDHAVTQRLSVLEEGVHAIRALLVAALPVAADLAPERGSAVESLELKSGVARGMYGFSLPKDVWES
ncbi:unnamed protein product [Aphanomyces euteiches]